MCIWWCCVPLWAHSTSPGAFACSRRPGCKACVPPWPCVRAGAAIGSRGGLAGERGLGEVKKAAPPMGRGGGFLGMTVTQLGRGGSCSVLQSGFVKSPSLAPEPWHPRTSVEHDMLVTSGCSGRFRRSQNLVRITRNTAPMESQGGGFGSLDSSLSPESKTREDGIGSRNATKSTAVEARIAKKNARVRGVANEVGKATPGGQGLRGNTSGKLNFAPLTSRYRTHHAPGRPCRL